MSEKNDRTVTIWYDYKFSDDELNELSDEFRAKFDESEKLESDKKSSVSNFNAQITEVGGRMKRLSVLLKDKKESRKIEATLRLNHTTKMREYYSQSTGELLKTEKFKEGDYQLELPIK